MALTGKGVGIADPLADPRPRAKAPCTQGTFTDPAQTRLNARLGAFPAKDGRRLGPNRKAARMAFFGLWAGWLKKWVEVTRKINLGWCFTAF